MDTVTAGPLERIGDRYVARPEKPRQTSARLVAAVRELDGYVRRQPDITLGELRAALLGTAFEWGADGTLTLSPSRVALVRELDDLITIHGWGARAADLVPC